MLAHRILNKVIDGLFKTKTAIIVIWSMKHDPYALVRFLLKLRKLINKQPQSYKVLFDQLLQVGWCGFLRSDESFYKKTSFLIDAVKIYRGELIKSIKIANHISQTLAKYNSYRGFNKLVKRRRNRLLRRAAHTRFRFLVIAKKKSNRLSVDPCAVGPQCLLPVASQALFLEASPL